MVKWKILWYRFFQNDIYTYKGNFKNNKKHGYGLIVWKDDSRYEGFGKAIYIMGIQIFKDDTMIYSNCYNDILYHYMIKYINGTICISELNN